jgi:hypothetical protein
VFADGKTWQAIHPSGNSLEFSICNQPSEDHGWQFLARQIPSTQQRFCPGKFHDSLLMLGMGAEIHDASMLQFIGICQ